MNFRTITIACFLYFIKLPWAFGALSYELIEKELSGFKKSEMVEGEFEQKKQLTELGMDILSSGSYKIYRFSDGHIKVVWNLKKPESMKICLTEEKIKIDKQSRSKGMSVNTQELATNQASNFKSMLSLMKLDAAEIFKTFKVIKEESEIFFEPFKPEDFSFLKASIKIDKKSNLQETNIFEKNGDRLQIKFLKTKKQKILTKDKKDC